MDAARRRGEELIDEAREDARLLRYLATDVITQGPALKNPTTDIDVTQRALLAGYAALLRHAHNLEHVLGVYDRMIEESG